MYQQSKVLADEIVYNVQNHDNLLNRNKIASSKCSLKTITEPSYMERSKEMGSSRASVSVSIRHVEEIATQHKRGINCLERVSGVCIATGSKDKTIMLNRLDRPELSVTLKGHSDQVTALLLFNEQLLVSGGGNLDPNVVVWSLNNSRQVQKLKGHQSGITTLRSLDDSVTMVSGSYDNTAKIWNLQKGECVTTLTKHSAMVSCVCRNGNYLMSGSWDKSMGVWKLQYHGKVVVGCVFASQVESDGPILCIEKLSDETVVFGGTSNKVFVCDFRTGRIERSIHGSQFGICELLVNGWVLGLGGSDSTLRLWQDWQEKHVSKEYDRIQINNYNTSKKLAHLHDGVFAVVNHSDKAKSFSLFEVK